MPLSQEHVDLDLDVNLNLNATVDLSARVFVVRVVLPGEEFDVSGSWISVENLLMPRPSRSLPGAVKVNVQGGV